MTRAKPVQVRPVTQLEIVTRPVAPLVKRPGCLPAKRGSIPLQGARAVLADVVKATG